MSNIKLDNKLSNNIALLEAGATTWPSGWVTLKMIVFATKYEYSTDAGRG